ncbi:hypothetical protein [Sinorhizobium medicae]|uniref:hypothetical protein n=1 Tax=Sinorhizobium medicae TaxID=110321 RepID=UPI0003A1A80C
MAPPILNSISKVTATSEPQVYLVRCNITEIDGITYDTDFCSRPDDPYGVNPQVREWLAANPDFPIDPYVPPTPEEQREAMPSLSAAQYRQGLVGAGHSPQEVTDAIAALPDGRRRSPSRSSGNTQRFSNACSHSSSRSASCSA